MPEWSSLNWQKQLAPNDSKDTLKHTLLMVCPYTLGQTSAPTLQLLWVLASNYSNYYPCLPKICPQGMTAMSFRRGLSSQGQLLTNE